ncbi:response regulator transcription factor [Microbacterium lacticum]|uniref:response regulator transcription factor n=1 Tax=Microbacterium lacticum TaxID=33885 RepID=UPI003211B0D3
MTGGALGGIRLLIADDQALVRGALSALLGLERDIEVVAEVGRGDEVVDAARALHLSEGTVRNHLSAAIGKTGGRNRADAARIADENGWL